MYNKRTSDNIVGTIQRDQFIADVDFGHTTGIGLYVAQIANMTYSCIRCTMRLFGWIEMWSSRCASICIVAEFMNMETMFAGSQATYFAGDCDWTTCACLNRTKNYFNKIQSTTNTNYYLFTYDYDRVNEYKIQHNVVNAIC